MKFNKKSFFRYFVLVLMIVLSFVTINMCNNKKSINIDLFGKNIKIKSSDILDENEEYYLSYDFIKKNIDEEIYYDSVSKKIVIASDKCLLKAKINEKEVSNNFQKESVEKICVIEKNEQEYVSLEVLEKAYDYDITKYKKTIYIDEKDYFECIVKTNDTRMYERSDFKSRVVNFADTKTHLTGILEKDGFVLVKTDDGKIGYISSKMLNYKLNIKGNVEKETKFSKYIFADSTNKYMEKGLGVDGVMLNMFNITQKSGDVNEQKIDSSFLSNVKNNGYKVYGIVTNGYNLAGFNTTTISQILSDESKRLLVINSLVGYSEKYNLDGIVVDFRMIKEEDCDNFTQFIKEFNAFYTKEVVVSINAGEYKNYVKAIKYSDFSIVNFYEQRDLNSNVSGSVSELPWMEQIIKNMIEETKSNKIVACIPSYSILWTEKNSNVVNSKVYNLSSIQDYITKNKLTKKYLENLKQNYIEFKKGSLVYRMWVEDDTSIKNRMEIIKNNNLCGVAIYKLGYENNDILSLINIE